MISPLSFQPGQELEQYRGVFEKIYIFSPSINIDDGWIPVKKYIEEDLGVNTERERAHYDEWDEAALRDIIQRQRKITETSKKLETKKLYQVLIICDVFTTNQITSALVAYRSAADQDTATASSIAAALLSYYTIAQVDGLLANKLGVTEAASALQIAVRFPDDGGADEVVAAIGEQILGPTDVSLSNWTVRPSSGPGHAHRGSKRGRLHPDPGGEPVENRAHLQLELLFACRYRLGTASNFVVYMSEADNVYDPLYGSFAGDEGAWSTMYFTVPPNGVAKLHFGAHFQAPGLPNQTAGTVDVYGLQILDATLEAGNTEEEVGPAAKHEFLDGGADDVTLATVGEVLLEPTLTTLGNFLVRSNSQSSVALASFAVGGFQLEGYAMTLSAFAWNIARTYTLTPGRRYSFGCRYRLGTASNLVMYVSAADNDYVGVTGTFLGTASQGVWSTARLDFSVPPGGIAKLHFWCSSRRARWTCTACRSGPRPSRKSLSE